MRSCGTICKPWAAGLILSVACLLPVGGMISAAPVASPGVLGPVAVVAKDGKRLFVAHAEQQSDDLIQFVRSL